MTQNIAHPAVAHKEVTPDYKRPTLPIDVRVADLLGRMSIEEKVAQMVCIWNQKKPLLFDSSGSVSDANLRQHFKDGIGQIARLSDTRGGLTAKEMAHLANRLQKFFTEETRLGIPVIFHEECLHGLAAKEATNFPQPIALASTFNPELLEIIYSAIAEDTRSRGAHQALTPVVDVARDPRWGRVEETFGEDPYLVARMGIAAVKGFQGNATFKDKKRVIATLKHFAAHGQPESGTNCAPVNISERVLRDTFLYTFKEVFTKANALSVMPSYNEIDGVPSHASKWLLRDVLRGEWGFKGFAISDYYAIAELHRRDEATSHAVAHDRAEAALLAVQAGVNIESPDPDCYPHLVELLNLGKVKESDIDDLVGPLLRYKFAMGLFEDPFVDAELVDSKQRTTRERPLARQAAAETITLLKNQDAFLPLNAKKLKTLAVIGPNADRVMLGGYSGVPNYSSTVLQGIREKVGSSVNVLYSEGCKITIGGSWNQDSVTFATAEENAVLIKEAVSVAAKSDAVVLVIGGNEQTSREGWGRQHLGDRASLDLFGDQNALVQAIHATGKPIVVVLFHGRPNSITFIEKNIPAILECWYLGQEGGVAVADALFGDVNPSGKLPISIPRSVGHIPSFYNYKPSARRGYIDDDISPLYPFGFGLSYTTFSFSNARLEKSVISRDESTTVLVDVKNTGSRAGAEVVQVYIRDLVSSVTRPMKELKGFHKITLQPGEQQTVSLAVTPDELAFTNVAMEYVVEPGEFEIMVGNSSRDRDLTKLLLRVR